MLYAFMDTCSNAYMLTSSCHAHMVKAQTLCSKNVQSILKGKHTMNIAKHFAIYFIFDMQKPWKGKHMVQEGSLAPKNDTRGILRLP